MSELRPTRYGRLLAPLAPLLVLVAFAAAFWPVVLLFAAPWLVGLAIVVVRSPSVLRGTSETPSTAEAALRRLSVR